MAFSVKIITITEPTSTTGDVAVTGVSLGVAAQAIIFLSSYINAAGSASDYGDFIGTATATGTGNQWVRTNFASNGASGSPYCHVDLDDTLCVRFVDASGTTLNGASLTSFDGSDGNFTLNWKNSVTSAYKITAIVLGGLTSAKASTFQRRSGTGTQTVSTGFASTDNHGVVLIAGGLNSTTAPPDGAGGRIYSNLCISTSATQRRASMANLNAVGPTDCTHFQANDAAYAAAGQSVADFDSWHASDGFTLNFTHAAGSQGYMGYLCLNGGQHYVAAATQPVTPNTGHQVFTSTGVDPIGAILWSVNQPVSATADAGDCKFSVGAAISSSSMAHHFAGSKNAVTTTDASRDYSTTAVLKMMTQNGASPSTEAAADYVSNDAGGATINWSAVDAVAREFNVWLFGAASGAPPAGVASPYYAQQQQ